MFKHDPKLGASPLLSNCHAPACMQAAEPYPEEAATCPVLNSSPRKKETSLIPSSLHGTSNLTLLEKALTISPQARARRKGHSSLPSHNPHYSVDDYSRFGARNGVDEGSNGYRAGGFTLGACLLLKPLGVLHKAAVG